ncbi:MAG: type II secretion system protein [Candidatus Riflebacteria bacterium]|nr:type II secretion system protein [Candidatus Riflebacteria bacterium]
MSARRGYTLVEVMVAALVLAVVMAMALTIFHHGYTREAKLDFHTRAVQTASLARAHLADDFGQILPVIGSTPQKTEGFGVSFDRTPDGDELPLDQTLAPRHQAVTYRFDPATHRLLRNERPIAVGQFLDVRFKFEASPVVGYTLYVTMALVPEEELRRPGPPSQVARFTFSFHSPQGTLGFSHAEWAGDKGL